SGRSSGATLLASPRSLPSRRPSSPRSALAPPSFHSGWPCAVSTSSRPDGAPFSSHACVVLVTVRQGNLPTLGPQFRPVHAGRRPPQGGSMLHTLPLSRLSLLLLMLAAACSGESPTAITDADLAITADHPAGARQALARKFARALTDPDFRSYVQSELAASRHPEGKIHLGRFMRGQSGRAARALGAAESEVRGAEALEVYFPVPEHRNAWDGGADVMVGTIGA